MSRLRGQRGAALLVVLMLVSLLAAIGLSLVLVVDTESAIVGNDAEAMEVHYAAESALECAAAVLRTRADWTPAPLRPSAILDECLDGAAPPLTRDRIAVDLVRLRAERQAETDDRYGTAHSDRPVWVLGAAGRLIRARPDDARAPYIVVWLADDAGDGDGDGLRDTNGVVVLRAQAFGGGAARTAVEVTVARAEVDGLPAVRALRWH